MQVLLTNRMGEGAGLQIIPETEAERDYLLNLDREFLRAFWVRTPGEMTSLAIHVQWFGDASAVPQ